MTDAVEVEAEFQRLTEHARALHGQSNLAGAVSVARQACEIVMIGLGSGHPRMITALANYGELLRQSGQLLEAEGPLVQAAEAARQHYPLRSHYRIEPIATLASYYVDAGQYERALTLHREVHELRRAHAPRGEGVAMSLSWIGVVQHRLGNLKQAERFLGEAIEIYRELGAERTPANASAAHNLAVVYAEQNNLGAAGRLFTRALQLRREMYGDNHAETIETIASLGTFYFKQGQLKEAQANYGHALALTRLAVGDAHPATAERCMELAHCLRYMRTREAAAASEPLLRQAYEIRRAAYGDHHPLTIATNKAWTSTRR